MIFKTAFELTAKNIRQPWPVIEVDDSEFDNFSIPLKYNNVKYVWILNKKYKRALLNTFDLTYSPREHQESAILFPLCFDDNKAPIAWNVIKLVPTFLTVTTVKKSNIISGYINTPFYYTRYERGLINKVISKSRDMRYRVAKTKSSFNEMLKDFNFKKFNKDYVLFVDVDVTLDPEYHFEVPPPSDNKMYHYSVKHSSTGLCYSDNSVVFVPYAYILSLQNSQAGSVEHVVIDDVVGELNDMSDPEFAWTRAYSTSGLILQNNFLLNQRNITNKILSSYLSASCRLSKYIIDGCSQASKDIEDNVKIDFNSFKETSKRFAEYVSKSVVTSNDLKPMLSKLEMIGRVYGEDSDQYKTMLSKLESV